MKTVGVHHVVCISACRFYPQLSDFLALHPTADPDAEIVASVDPRRSQHEPAADVDSDEARDLRRAAYLAFISDLEDATPGVILSEDVDNAGNKPPAFPSLFLFSPSAVTHRNAE